MPKLNLSRNVFSSTCFKPSSSTPNPVRIIPGPTGLVQRAKQLKENVFILDPDGALMSTQEYMHKVVEDVGEDYDFNSDTWISATNYVLSTGGTVTRYLGDINNFLEKGKLKQVIAIVKSCSPNCLGDLNVTMKDLSGGLTEDELHQLAKDEEALKEVLKEEAKREKENAIYNKKLEEY
ncbi:hypothetical protein Tco_0704528 [Tanacetum coccineum]|uniref:Uncharacterized protein n=1 Tax=Tanacetum coccineum TaxID=301880 RepID=A0ABQ4Y2R4_9ASTR